jgi:hypothetical protein
MNRNPAYPNPPNFLARRSETIMKSGGDVMRNPGKVLAAAFYCGAFCSLILASTAWAGTAFVGNYYLLNVHSGKALDVDGVSVNNGANVHQWDYVNGANQKWQFVPAGNGTYSIKSVNSQKCLDVTDFSTSNGANVQQWSCSGNNNQKWRVTQVATGIYRVENVGSGKVLDVTNWSTANGGNVQQWSWANGDNQKWKIIPVGAVTNLSGTYRITSVNSGKVVDVEGVSRAPAANVHQWDYVNGANQRWRLLNTGTGYYKIQSVNSGDMLDVANASAANNANIQQYPDNGNNAQLFALINAGNGTYAIRNKNSGKVLDVANWSKTNGGNIHQWQYFGQANQKWRLAKVDGGSNSGGSSNGGGSNCSPIWSDEFNYNGLPDSSKWSYEVQRPGWVNNEMENYTGYRAENAYVRNGHLTIFARRDWYNGYEISSARLKTIHKGDWRNGRIKVRAKLPQGRGTWPAIWMMPTDSAYGGWPNSGEIDIMESVSILMRFMAQRTPRTATAPRGITSPPRSEAIRRRASITFTESTGIRTASSSTWMASPMPPTTTRTTAGGTGPSTRSSTSS